MTKTNKNQRVYCGSREDYRLIRFTLVLNEADEFKLNTGYKKYLKNNPSAKSKSAFIRYLINNYE